MNKSLKHFSKLTKKQVETMCNRCIDAAVNYFEEQNLSGLSHSGVHDIYKAIQDAIWGEWLKSKAIMKRTGLDEKTT